LEHPSAATSWTLLKQLGVAINADDLKADTIIVACHPFTKTGDAKSKGAA